MPCYNDVMYTLSECIKDAKARKVAIGHFNISNLEMVWAVFEAAQEASKAAGRLLPVIIGVSEGERDFVGLAQIVAVVKSIREQYGYPLFLNADHSYSFERVRDAIEAGFDAVIYDGAKLSVQENKNVASQCVAYARQYEARTGRKVLVESELGYIGQSSKILDALPEGAAVSSAQYTTPEEAKSFVEATGVDLFAPAVGNIHGMLRGGKDPRLDIERIAMIARTVGASLVLHGGSGTDDGDFLKAIDAGMAIIHISTELRLAFQQTLKATLDQNPDEIAPYRYLKPARDAVKTVVLARLKLFNKIA
jgi:fructose-bisphosphate aldolase, class II